MVKNMKTLRILFTLITLLNCISGIKAMDFDTVVKMKVDSTSDTEDNSNYDTCGKRELTKEEAEIIETNLKKALENVNVQELPIGKATRTKPSIVHKVYNTSFYNEPTQNSTHGLKDVITVLDTTKPAVVLDSNNTRDTNDEDISSGENTIKLNSTYAHELLNKLNASEEVLNTTQDSNNVAPSSSNAKIWEIKEKRNPNKYVNGYSDELMSDLNQFLNSVEASNNKNRYTKFFIGGIALGVLTTSIVALIKYANKINNEFKSIIMKQKGLSNNAAELICNKTSFREKIKSIKQYNSAMRAHA